jgi:hypothetical protein
VDLTKIRDCFGIVSGAFTDCLDEFILIVGGRIRPDSIPLLAIRVLRRPKSHNNTNRLLSLRRRSVKNVSLILLLAVALGTSAVTLLVERMVFHPSATEAQATSALEGFQFTPQHRKDDHVDESFFFFNPKTGDIWVYQEDKPKEHYRVITIGEKLQKLN